MDVGVGNDLIDLQDSILCCFCETEVAYVDDYVPNGQDLVYGGYSNDMFHVYKIGNENHQQQRDGNTLAYIYCIECHIVIGWELIAVAHPSEYFVVGRYFMRLHLLMYQSGVTLHDGLFGGAIEQAPNDQDVGANVDQEGGPNADQVGGANNQVGGANAGQDGDANAVQDGGANNQVGGANADQDGGANNQVGSPNADQDGDANDQHGDVNEQDLGANEQNVNQDEDANEQDHDEDGGPPMKQRKM